MKKSHLAKRGFQDANQLSSQPDKVGWIRKFCGKGIFREIWRNRFVMLKGDHLYIFEKEMKDDGKTHEVFDLAEYERSEELCKAKSRSKKNHSKFTLLRCRQPGNRTPNLVFLAVSPEEKESWINVLNGAITRAKNHILDEVMIEEENLLVHPTRDRAKIPLGRRLPTRGHLTAVASTSSDGMLTLDLVHEEDATDEQHVWVKDFRVDLDKLAPGRRRSGTDISRLHVAPADGKVKSGSLPRGSELSWGRVQPLEGQQCRTPQLGERLSAQGRSRCASMDETRPARRDACGRQATMARSPTGHLQDLINQRLQRTQELLAEIHEQELPSRGRMDSYPHLRGIDSPRIRHLKGSESPHLKGSNSPHGKGLDSPSLKVKDSPNVKGKDSPRLKVKDSPRVKASKLSHSKGPNSPRSKSFDSPDSRGSNSPHTKSTDLSHVKGSDSPHSNGSSSPRLRGTDSPSLRPSNSPHLKGADSFRTKATNLPLSEGSDWDCRRAVAERLLQEAISSWQEAREVLVEVKELQARQRRAEQNTTETPSAPPQDSKPKSS